MRNLPSDLVIGFHLILSVIIVGTIEDRLEEGFVPLTAGQVQW